MRILNCLRSRSPEDPCCRTGVRSLSMMDGMYLYFPQLYPNVVLGPVWTVTTTQTMPARMSFLQNPTSMCREGGALTQTKRWMNKFVYWNSREGRSINLFLNLILFVWVYEDSKHGLKLQSYCAMVLQSYRTMVLQPYHAIHLWCYQCYSAMDLWYYRSSVTIHAT